MFTEYVRPTLIEVMTPHCVECRAMKPDLDADESDSLRASVAAITSAFHAL